MRWAQERVEVGTTALIMLIATKNLFKTKAQSNPHTLQVPARGIN